MWRSRHSSAVSSKLSAQTPHVEISDPTPPPSPTEPANVSLNLTWSPRPERIGTQTLLAGRPLALSGQTARLSPSLKDRRMGGGTQRHIYIYIYGGEFFFRACNRHRGVPPRQRFVTDLPCPRQPSPRQGYNPPPPPPTRQQYH